jgi:hypothetical protein
MLNAVNCNQRAYGSQPAFQSKYRFLVKPETEIAIEEELAKLCDIRDIRDGKGLYYLGKGKQHILTSLGYYTGEVHLVTDKHIKEHDDAIDTEFKAIPKGILDKEWFIKAKEAYSNAMSKFWANTEPITIEEGRPLSEQIEFSIGKTPDSEEDFIIKPKA